MTLLDKVTVRTIERGGWPFRARYRVEIVVSSNSVVLFYSRWTNDLEGAEEWGREVARALGAVSIGVPQWVRR